MAMHADEALFDIALVMSAVVEQWARKPLYLHVFTLSVLQLTSRLTHLNIVQEECSVLFTCRILS